MLPPPPEHVPQPDISVKKKGSEVSRKQTPIYSNDPGILDAEFEEVDGQDYKPR